ncbi:ATP-binding protein [Streptomyces sp. SP18CS02]|uniref:ATP-binding protein n=1 Tax=Streptomyces sp. SP18CS02 TaxID=3002531 RepID=UPI002E7AA787|nr:ATP-binding protein [Streptomyces sp. SP18CS02]MEE1756391.1 ATP-binding protein [Streptomyces sp. SP18CS02]
MSLPLTRRIARAALLIAAGAAPVVGAAGSASAVDLPRSTDLGGVSALDTGAAGDTVGGASENVTGAVGDTGGTTVKKAVPAAGQTVGKTGKTATPVAQKAAGETAGTTGELVGGAAGAATEAAPTDALGGGLPKTGLPVG